MPSYGWPPYNGGVVHVAGALFRQLQIRTIRGQSPRRCGPGCAEKPALDAGWHGFPQSSGVKRRAAPRQGVPASHGASWRRTGRGDGGESDPLFFGAGAPPGRGRWCTPKSTTSPPLLGGRSHHRDPCGKAIEPMRKPGPPHRPEAACNAHENADSDSNKPKVVRVETGAVTQHCAGDDLFAPLLRSGTSGFRSMSRTV